MKISQARTAIKQLLLRIDRLCREEEEAELDRALKAGLKDSRVCGIVQTLKILHVHLEEVEKNLAAIGFSLDYDGELRLSRSRANAIHLSHQSVNERFKGYQERLLVRFAIADEEEKQFLIRDFFAEVEKSFPSLKHLLNKSSSRGNETQTSKSV